MLQNNHNIYIFNYLNQLKNSITEQKFRKSCVLFKLKLTSVEMKALFKKQIKKSLWRKLQGMQQVIKIDELYALYRGSRTSRSSVDS